MKIALERSGSLVAHLISTLPELPCNIVTSLRTFPERMYPPALNAANP
jgi:hypothetical protein